MSGPQIVRETLDRLEQRAEVVKHAMDGLAGLEHCTPRERRRQWDDVADGLAAKHWPNPGHWSTADGKAWHLRGVAHHQIKLMLCGCATGPDVTRGIVEALVCALSMLVDEIDDLRETQTRYKATNN